MAERVLISAAGFLIAKPGKQATSSTPGDFLVNTSLVNSRLLYRGSASVANNATFTYAHGLGYIPLYQFSQENAFVTGGFGGLPAGYGCYVWMDTTNLNIQNNGSGITAICHFSIFIDRWY